MFEDPVPAIGNSEKEGMIDQPDPPHTTGESEGTPTDIRKQWGKGEGVSLVAMLQDKTLQGATYAVQSGGTQSKYNFKLSQLLIECFFI